MILEAMERVRAAELRAREEAALAKKQGKDLVTRARKEGEAERAALRRQLEQERLQGEEALRARMEHCEAEQHRETREHCDKLRRRAEEHMVQAVQYIAREVTASCRS